ncbi:zf-HC2 domain-containing protein [Stigmatella sp. ncwal1]|uniref:Zf-HC2 domain-containing protein n=1 Tax=Stigmatella ashevillensis TaxID=2995309 RepID=A0ABT5DLL5_9BACT|nr:zf-HC2 domain-containing protein [Stigmatella ashevillena]MDC0713919.1 zf-HC2 domain-containing protein [Stigmatella ashevillena]
MSCTFEEELTAFIDGELSPPRHAEIAVHLGTCAQCQSTEALLRGTLAKMALLPESIPSPATRRQVLAQVDALPPPLKERLLALLRPRVLVPALGLAAVMALAVYPRSRPGVDEADPGALELAANLELVEDYDVVGLDSFEDMEVVTHLHELEVQ